MRLPITTRGDGNAQGAALDEGVGLNAGVKMTLPYHTPKPRTPLIDPDIDWFEWACVALSAGLLIVWAVG